MSRSLCFVSAFAVASLLSGCAVGPDFQTPKAPEVSSFLPASGANPAAADRVPGRVIERGANVSSQWWELFRSAGLDRLVQEGIAHNADLEAAEAALRVAQANAMAQRGALFPVVGVGIDAAHQKGLSEVVVDPDTGQSRSIYSVVTRQVSVSFVPDVWGGTRRQIESADAQVELQAFQRDGVYLTLASNIALGAIEEGRLRGQIAATRRIIDLQVDLLRLIRKQYEQGQTALPDVVTQETALAQSRLLLPPLDKQLAQQRNLLAQLVGRFPSDADFSTFRLASFRMPRRLPLSLPGDLVRQRPDIRAAEANLRATNAQIGVAIANRLPQITLTGNVGRAGSNVPDLSPAGAFWTIAGSAVQTVFDAGTLANRQLAAEEGTNQAVAQYRSVVLTSFQNVANVLRALQADERALNAAAAAEKWAEQNVTLVRRQVEQGQVNIALLITAQQAYLQTSLARVYAEAARLADTVALFQALGGGWWNRPERVAEQTGELR